MLIAALFSSFTAVAPLECAVVPAPAAVPLVAVPVMPAERRDTALVALYESGQDFDAFLKSANARKAMWEKHWAEGVVAEDQLAKARAVPGRWRLLIVAVDGCSDSVNTVPFIARLVSMVPSLELRIVQPGPGRPVQEAHRTPDGRAATPTLVLLDEQGNDAGCWVERPAELQDSAIKARAAGTIEEWARGKQDWYDQDAGASTVREVVAILEAAAAGAPLCRSGEPPARTP